MNRASARRSVACAAVKALPESLMTLVIILWERQTRLAHCGVQAGQPLHLDDQGIKQCGPWATHERHLGRSAGGVAAVVLLSLTLSGQQSGHEQGHCLAGRQLLDRNSLRLAMAALCIDDFAYWQLKAGALATRVVLVDNTAPLAHLIRHNLIELLSRSRPIPTDGLPSNEGNRFTVDEDTIRLPLHRTVKA
jgi:hypothetical protein